MKRLVVALAVAGLFAAAGSPPGGAQTGYVAGSETPESWPAGENREETFYMCTACHSSGLITRVGMTREQWDDMFQLMVTRHNMAPVDDKDRAAMVTYLAAAFPPRAPSQQGGWRNPFAPR